MLSLRHRESFPLILIRLGHEVYKGEERSEFPTNPPFSTTIATTHLLHVSTTVTSKPDHHSSMKPPHSDETTSTITGTVVSRFRRSPMTSALCTDNGSELESDDGNGSSPLTTEERAILKLFPSPPPTSQGVIEQLKVVLRRVEDLEAKLGGKAEIMGVLTEPNSELSPVVAVKLPTTARTADTYRSASDLLERSLNDLKMVLETSERERDTLQEKNALNRKILAGLGPDLLTCQQSSPEIRSWKKFLSSFIRKNNTSSGGVD